MPYVMLFMVITMFGGPATGTWYKRVPEPTKGIVKESVTWQDAVRRNG